jgi:hypothetical protein
LRHLVEPAIAYAKFFTCSHDAVIRVFDEAGNVIETHEQAARLQRLLSFGGIPFWNVKI